MLSLSRSRASLLSIVGVPLPPLAARSRRSPFGRQSVRWAGAGSPLVPLVASLSLSFLAGEARAATPQELAKSAHEAVLKGTQKPGATVSDGMVVAVGRAPVASFGNARRAALRAEEQAELAALGELRLWAMANRNVDMDALTAKLGRPVPPDALRAYLGTVAGDVEIKDILATMGLSLGMRIDQGGQG